MEVQFITADYQVLLSGDYERIAVGTGTLAQAFADGFEVGGIAVTPAGSTVIVALQRPLQPMGHAGAP